MFWILALACSTPEPGHPVHGVVVEVSAADEVLLDHDAIPGFMDAMVMPFHVQDRGLLKGLQPGDIVDARLEIGEQGGFLTKLEVVGKGPAPKPPERAPGPLREGQQLPATPIHYADGTEGVLGAGQGHPVALTFLYTRCPMPDFCPATVAKYQALQPLVKAPIELVAVSLDPTFDTDAVLTDFAANAGAEPGRWRFGRVQDLDALALAAGMSVMPKDGEILHAKRVLLLDADGRMLARYDDHSFSVQDAAALLEGKP